MRIAARLRLQRGVTSIEYALLGALIAVAVIASVTTAGAELSKLFDRVASAVAAAVGS